MQMSGGSTNITNTYTSVFEFYNFSYAPISSYDNTGNGKACEDHVKTVSFVRIFEQYIWVQVCPELFVPSICTILSTDHTFLLFNSQCPTKTIGQMMTLVNWALSFMSLWSCRHFPTIHVKFWAANKFGSLWHRAGWCHWYKVHLSPSTHKVISIVEYKPMFKDSSSSNEWT